MIPVTDAALEVYRPGNATTTPDFQIGADETSDLAGFEITHRLGEVLSECTIELHNEHGTYTDVTLGRAFGEGVFGSGPFGRPADHVSQHAIRIGDRVRMDIDVVGSGVYGETYGAESEYGGAPTPDPWMGVVEPVDHSRESVVDATLQFDATDFAGGVLSYRNITDHYDNRDVGDIIRDICERKAPEVDPSNIGTFNTRTDKSYSKKNCWEAVKELAALADAVPRHDGIELHIDQIDALPFAFEIQPQDIIPPLEAKQTPDQLHNVVRVEAGKAQIREVDRDTFDSWTRVTDTTRQTYQVRARKSHIARVDLYVGRDDTSDDGLKVRLQADEGGAPVAIDDEDSDIMRPASRATDDDAFPETEGWLSFFIEEHTLPDRDPWIIVEADGADGHDIGLQADGDLMVRTAYNAPRNFEARNADSIARYRHRQKQIDRDNLTSLGATRDAAQMELKRRSWPRQTVSFEANTYRAHALSPGDLVDIWMPEDGAYGRYVVVERSLSLDTNNPIQLSTDITVMSRDGLLASTPS